MGMPGSMRQAVAMVGGCEPGGARIIPRDDWFWFVRDRDDGFRLDPVELKFLLETPGASRPRQVLCRLSGAGDVGKRRVVYETHIVVRESRPCGMDLDVENV